MKKTLLILALTVSVLGVAEGSYALETDITTTGALAEGRELNGTIQGQFLNGTMTDCVKGVGASARPASSDSWNGFITGAPGAPRKTDLAVLPVRESRGKDAWNGYTPGALGYWERKL